MSAYNGSGTYVISGVGLPFVTGTTISSTVANTLNSDLATGLSTAICKDGQTTPTANLPMGGYHHTGVADPTAADQYMTVNQAQLGSSTLLSGTFTPTDASGAGLTFSSAVGVYRRLPGAVMISLLVTYPVTADGTNVKIGSLPFTSLNAGLGGYPVSAIPSGGGLPSANGFVIQNTTTVSLLKAGGLAVTNANMSGSPLYISGVYPI